MNNLSLAKKIIIYFFLSVPIISATISAIHLERFLAIGNPTTLSISTAIAYEIANLTIMFIFILLPKANKTFIWITFVMLILMQIIGNIYFSFNFIYTAMEQHSDWIKNWMRIISIFSFEPQSESSVFILSCILGVPVPLVALLLTKSVAIYLGDEEQKTPEIIENITTKEEVVVEHKPAKEMVEPIVVESSDTEVKSKDETNDRPTIESPVEEVQSTDTTRKEKAEIKANESGLTVK